MPDRDHVKATAVELGRIAGFLANSVRSDDEPDPDMINAAAAELMHLAAGLMGAEEGTGVAVRFGAATRQ